MSGLQVTPTPGVDTAKPADAQVTIVEDSGGRLQARVSATPPALIDPADKDAGAEPAQPDAVKRPDWLPEKFKEPIELKNSTVELMKKHGANPAFIRGIEASESGAEVAAVYAEFEKKNTPEAGKPPVEKPKDPTPEEKAAAEKAAADAAATPFVKSDEVKTKERADYGDALASIFDKAEVNGTDLAAEMAKDGKLSDASYAKLAKSGIPKTLVDKVLGDTKAEAQVLAESQVKELKDSVGGEAEFTKIAAWAGVPGNMPQDGLDLYNAMVNSPDKRVAQRAVKDLHEAYVKANGKQPRLQAADNGGPGGAAAGDRYESWAQVREDMSTKAYKDNDPAFHKKVEAKLQRSSL